MAGQMCSVNEPRGFPWSSFLPLFTMKECFFMTECCFASQSHPRGRTWTRKKKKGSEEEEEKRRAWESEWDHLTDMTTAPEDLRRSKHPTTSLVPRGVALLWGGVSQNYGSGPTSGSQVPPLTTSTTHTHTHTPAYPACPTLHTGLI